MNALTPLPTHTYQKIMVLRTGRYYHVSLEVTVLNIDECIAEHEYELGTFGSNTAAAQYIAQYLTQRGLRIAQAFVSKGNVSYTLHLRNITPAR